MDILIGGLGAIRPLAFDPVGLVDPVLLVGRIDPAA